MVEACGQSGLMAEVPREEHEAHARIGGGEAFERDRRAISRAIVDEDELEVDPVERYAHPRVELVDQRLLVEDRGDDAEQVELAWPAGSAGVGHDGHRRRRL